MSASREKKTRQERGADYVDPKLKKEQEEKQAARRTTAIFTVCALAFAAFIVFSALNNSGIFKRGAAAASAGGKTYTASDVAYYYYNARSSILNNNSSLTNTSLRDQAYTASDDYETWYDYAVDQSFRSMTSIEATVAAANAAGYSDPAVDESVNSTLDSLKSSASKSGYSLDGYIKAIFGGLVTRSQFTRMLRNAVLADSYISSKAQPSAYTEAELQAELDADPNAYASVSYEAVVFPASDFATEAAEATDTTPAVEADDGTAGAKAAANALYARYRAGESLEALATELGGTYMNTSTAYSTGSDMNDWLFDDARKDGNAAVLDYTYYGYNLGSVVTVFHDKALADYHTVNVRHILVEDEATAKDLLAQYEAGERTEDAFAALATANSTDTGSASNGGLYENVNKGQMVEPFEAWCFDDSRQAGDTGIVKTDYGYHVMYFVGRSEYAYWQQLAASKLSSAWEATLSEKVDVEQLDGMKYIDP